MNIAHGINKRVGICDIETMRELFYVASYDMDTGDLTDFEISKWGNDLYRFVKWYQSMPCDYLVTFNGISFDQQVLQYIVDMYEKWYDLKNLEICERIADYASKIIENQNYGISSQYREHQFSIPAIDVFRIHHFDNEARRTSLKWCAFMMNMSVEEMPIHHNTKGLTQEDITTIKDYCRNDILVTKKLFELTLGVVDLPHLTDYKGKNKIQDRFDVEKETGLKCLNWSDVKIGEEWNKRDYKIAENVGDDNLLMPTKVKYPYGKKFKSFFPKTMKFTTPHLQNFIEKLGNQYIRAIKQEFVVTVGNTSYTIAKGGIHSREKNRTLIPPKGRKLRDADVGSQYPNSIVKLDIYPPHLKKTILLQYNEKIDKRITYKRKANELKEIGKTDEARPYSSVQDMLKLCLNGGYYGKLGQKGSFLEYPEGLLKVCVGNQVEILMLIEMMEEAGFQVVSGNTDGIVVLFPEEREDDYNAICSKWEETVGNVKMGKLEYTDFSGLWQESINSYIAKTTKGTIKRKGRFVTVYGGPGCEINKNKSGRIIPLALEAYFINGRNPVEFIKGHTDIFDFCIAKKSAGNLHYEEITDKETKLHKKLIVYYVSTNGNIFKKRGITSTNKRMDAYCEAANKSFPELGFPKLTCFNRPFIPEKFSGYNIDYDYYILEALERIDKIEKTNKAKKYVESMRVTQQLTLF